MIIFKINKITIIYLRLAIAFSKSIMLLETDSNDNFFKSWE